MIAGLKPYPEYKESGVPWLGRIPGHWDVAPGRAVFAEKQVRNRGLAEKRVLSLSYGRIVVKPEDKLHGLIPESFGTYQIVEPGDLIIRATDLQNDHTSLRAGFVRDRGIITSAYLCLTGRGALTSEFGYMLLHAYDLMKILYGLGSGLRQNLSFRDIRDLPVVVPPIEEQHAVERFIRAVDQDIDRTVRGKKKLIALLSEQKQAIINRAVTRGLDPAGGLKPSGTPWLGDIPEHWEVVSIGAACSLIQTGPFGSQLHSHEYVFGGIPLINPAHMRDGRIVSDKRVTITPLKARALHRHRVYSGDILAARRGELGRCASATDAEDGWVCGTGSLLIRCAEGIMVPAYFQKVFSSNCVRDALSLASIGATMENLNAGTVARLRIPRPPLPDQHRIVAHVETAIQKSAAAISRAQREIDLIREYRTRLVADVVTGQLDVREASRDLPAEIEQPDVLIEADTVDESEELLEAIAADE